MKILIPIAALVFLGGCGTIQSLTGNGELPKEVNECYDQSTLKTSLLACIAVSADSLQSAASESDLETLDNLLDTCINSAITVSRVEGQCVEDPNN